MNKWSYTIYEKGISVFWEGEYQTYLSFEEIASKTGNFNKYTTDEYHTMLCICRDELLERGLIDEN